MYNNWIRDGAVFAEDFRPLRTFNDLVNMSSRLKEIGIKTVELFGLWDHCNSTLPGYRWATRDFSKLDSSRGSENDFIEFVDKYHSLGMYIIPLVVTNISILPNDKMCIDKTCEEYQWDTEGVGGALYRYQLENPEKNIFMKNVYNYPVCDYAGFGWVSDLSSSDVIDFFTDFYNREIIGRNLDGIRLDTPNIHNCKSDTVLYYCNKTCVCPDPSYILQDPLTFLRKMRSLMLPHHVFMSEVFTTIPRFTDAGCSYPYYPTSADPINTDLDEVAEASEGYEFMSLIIDILKNRLSSEQFVEWVNNQPISFGRTRFRMVRNWNGDKNTMRFVSMSKAYFPSVTLACTIPGIPKVSDYELFGYSPIDKYYNIVRTNTPEMCSDHWKRILNIRNNSICLTQSSNINNILKTGDNIFAYLRSNENENIIVVVSYSNKTSLPTLNLSFIEKGTILKDELSNDIFIIDTPDNFNISMQAYGSRILTIQTSVQEQIRVEQVLVAILGMGAAYLAAKHYKIL